MKQRANLYAMHVAVLIAVMTTCLIIGCDNPFTGSGNYPVTTAQSTKTSEYGLSLAGKIDLKGNVDDLNNDLVLCKTVRPLRAGDSLAAYTSTDRAVSLDNRVVEANGRSATYPLLALLKDANGRVGSIVLADAQLKLDVPSRKLVKRNGCLIFAMRELKAGQAFKVLYNPDLGAASIERETVSGMITPVLLITVGSDPKQDKARQLVSLWAAADSLAGK